MLSRIPGPVPDRRLKQKQTRSNNKNIVVLKVYNQKIIDRYNVVLIVVVSSRV